MQREIKLILSTIALAVGWGFCIGIGVVMVARDILVSGALFIILGVLLLWVFCYWRCGA